MAKNVYEQKLWRRCREACEDPRHASYRFYGARGIECRLTSGQDILDAIGPRPSPAHWLERIDKKGHYEVGNIRWRMEPEVRSSVVHTTPAGFAAIAKATKTRLDACRARGNRCINGHVKEDASAPCKICQAAASRKHHEKKKAARRAKAKEVTTA